MRESQKEPHISTAMLFFVTRNFCSNESISDLERKGGDAEHLLNTHPAWEVKTRHRCTEAKFILYNVLHLYLFFPLNLEGLEWGSSY